MAKTKCNTCGGVYDTLLPDTMRYFHACPPQALLRAKRLGVWQDVPLDQVQPTDTVEVVRAGVKIDSLVAALQKDDLRLGDTTAPRPNARDENVVPNADGTSPATIKAAGNGVTLV